VTASRNLTPDTGIKLWTASGRVFAEEPNGRIEVIIGEELFGFAVHDATGNGPRRRWYPSCSLYHNTQEPST